jgi:hypothetical protein
MCFRLDGPGKLLLDIDLWKNLGHRQIHVRFSPGYNGGQWMKRIARTELADPFHGPCGPTEPGEVSLTWTDNRSKVIHRNIAVQHLLPCQPRFVGDQAIVLSGPKKGVLVEVFCCKKKLDFAVVHAYGSDEKWEELKSNICLVKPPPQ